MPVYAGKTIFRIIRSVDLPSYSKITSYCSCV